VAVFSLEKDGFPITIHMCGYFFKVVLHSTLLFLSAHFDSRNLPPGGDSFCIGRHFLSDIGSADDVATWVAMLAA
jgi:hypothetical protein